MTAGHQPTDWEGPATGSESAWDPPVSSDARPHFRPDIEGLRAIAILAVLAYHARAPGFSGGFVGVDVFFVISGFLITGLLLRERDRTGRIDLRGFYARRARRLLPAALVVVAVTVGVSTLVLSRLRFPEVAADAAASALYVSNYRFALTATDYFAADAPPSPLLHYWSLGVEEQFYVFWPLALMVAIGLWSRRRLWIPILVVAGASFALSVIVTGVQPPWAFYSLPTRAWQIAIGALIAIGATWIRVPGHRRLMEMVGVTGIGLIVAAIVIVNETTGYPGLAAMLPAVGAGLLVVAGERRDAFTTRLLASPVPRWFGRISYSLYLWHWPVLILGPQLLGRGDLGTRLALAVASVAIAAVSTHYIEKPFRVTGRNAHVRSGRTLVASGAVSLAVAASALMASVGFSNSSSGHVLLGELPGRSDPRPRALKPVLSGPIPADLHPSLFDARTDRDVLGTDGCQTAWTDSTVRDCSYGDPDARMTVVLFGDSHAAMWFPALERIASERSWRIVPLVKFGCAPVSVTIWDNRLKRAFHECDAWRSAAMARIDELRPSITLVATSRNYQVTIDQSQPIRAGAGTVWRGGLVRTLAEALGSSSAVVLIGESPHHGDDPLECLAASSMIESCPAPRSEVVDPAYEALEAAAAREAGAAYLRTTDWLCPGAACPLVMDSILVYRNPGHLTATITAALAPRLLWELDQLE